MQNFGPAYVIAVADLQTAEDNRRSNSQNSEAYESLVNPSDHFCRLRVNTGNKERGSQTSSRHTKTNRHLLHGTGDGAGATGVLLGDVGEHQRIHARVLQRSKRSS